jgi:hypothetical protein
MYPFQGIAAVIAAATSVIIVLSIFFYSTRFESKHQADKKDEH